MAVILANAYDEYHQKNTPKNGIPKKTHRWTATRFTQLSPRAPAVTEAIQSAAHYACHRLNATFGDATITAQFESLVREILATMLQGSDPRYTVATTPKTTLARAVTAGKTEFTPVTRRVNELTA